MPEIKLVDQIRNVIRIKHYSLSTEKTYIGWIRRYLAFHHMRHPRQMGAPEKKLRAASLSGILGFIFSPSP